METSRDYYEDRIDDYNRYRRGRSLYQYCKDEGIDYKWMLRAQRQFGAGEKRNEQPAGGDSLTTDDRDLIRLHFEEDIQPTGSGPNAAIAESTRVEEDRSDPASWTVSDVVIRDPEGNEITLRCGSVHALGRILTRLAGCHD